ncbi:hypothetical protein GJ744_004895 [Endocarpon pusillum]|uniref:Uncharacterized protein n=1 Tax=Endocarpon pusillum TaxID=364733 RepID=A0A8H7E7K1_9EURO|nr:hypothetical protein GJ744_004895 [Endocarpon pusillum]
MSWDRAAYGAFDRLLGYSQEYLDRVYKGAEEYRAYLDAQGRLNTSWEAAESDSDYDNVPLSLLPTPKHQSSDPLSKE